MGSSDYLKGEILDKIDSVRVFLGVEWDMRPPYEGIQKYHKNEMEIVEKRILELHDSF